MNTLLDEWNLYYHDPNDKDYSEQSYINLMTIKTANDFWDIFDVIKKEKWTTGMFFLMRKGYRPLWDAPENAKGGIWTKKVDVQETYDVFLDCMVHALAERLLKQNNECIVGVSISPKSTFHILKYWNKGITTTEWQNFNPSLKMKLGKDIAWKANTAR